MMRTGRLTVMVQMLSKVEVLRMLPPQAFWPAPKIDSALVRLVRQDKLGNSANDFTRFVHQVFFLSAKNAAKSIGDVEPAGRVDPGKKPA